MKVTDNPVVTIGKVLQKEGYSKGGSYTWPIWMVQLILEQLANRTPPADISPNIVFQAAPAMPAVKFIVQELPSINFIQKCRTYIRIIGEALADYLIGKVNQWDQLLYYGTVGLQIVLQNLVISAINKEHLCPLIISTFIIL